MRSTSPESTSDRQRAPLRQRGAAFLLALVIEGLLALLFLSLVPSFAPKEKRTPLIFGLDIPAGDTAEPEAAEAEAEARSRGGAAEKAPRPLPPDPVVEPPPIPETVLTPKVLWLSRRDYAASDIAALESPGEPAPSNNEGRGRSQGNDSELAEGRGPNGEPLYAAEWHVRPTNAQLATYLPRRRQEGWGMIACRTVANYRVEDCQELGDSPRGSGLAGAVRQAAWQFRVRPPRVGGRALVGAWVRIRIDYSVTPAEGTR